LIGIVVTLFFCVVIGFMLLLAAQLSSLGKKLTVLQRTLSRTDTDSEALRKGIYQLAGDVSQMRSLLRLKPRHYRFMTETQQESNNERDMITPYLKGLDILINTIEQKSKVKKLNELSNHPNWKSFLLKHKLEEKRSKEELQVIDKTVLLFHIRYNVTSTQYLAYILQDQSVAMKSGDILQFVQNIRMLFPNAQKRIQIRNEQKRALLFLTREDKILALHKEKKLSFAPMKENTGAVFLPVMRFDKQVFLLSFSFLDKKFHFLDRDFDSAEELSTTYIQYLQHTEVLTEAERRLRGLIEAVREVLRDKGVVSYLAEHQFHVSDTARDDGEHVFFDILSDSGQRVGSIAIHRYTFDVWIMDKDDVPIISLLRFSNGDFSIPATQVRDAKEAVTNILLVGLHEELADTIMVASISPHKNQGSIFSLPRDLFYQGRKINALYRRYGQQGFANEIGRIIGIPIHHYVFVDMYAFIEVVNILGGIEVDLKASLIDPTYKVKKDGKWSTLYYSKGIHYVNGREALRIARSRHSSNDFSRSDRQQMIVQAVLQKLSDAHLYTVEKLYEFLKISMKYVITDLNPFQVLQYVALSRKLDNIHRTVIDTSNVLYHTYSNLYYTGKTADEIDESFFKGLWILLPLDNDWNNIPRFVRSFLSPQAL